MSHRFLFIAILLLSLYACAHKPKDKPKWVGGKTINKLYTLSDDYFPDIETAKDSIVMVYNPQYANQTKFHDGMSYLLYNINLDSGYRKVYSETERGLFRFDDTYVPSFSLKKWRTENDKKTRILSLQPFVVSFLIGEHLEDSLVIAPDITWQGSLLKTYNYIQTCAQLPFDSAKLKPFVWLPMPLIQFGLWHSQSRVLIAVIPHITDYKQFDFFLSPFNSFRTDTNEDDSFPMTDYNENHHRVVFYLKKKHSRYPQLMANIVDTCFWGKRYFYDKDSLSEFDKSPHVLLH